MKPLNLGYNWLHDFAKKDYLLRKLINKKTKEPLYKDKWISILKYIVNNVKNVTILKELNRYLYFLDHINDNIYNVPQKHKFRDFDGSISVLDVRQYKNSDKENILFDIFSHIKSTKLNNDIYDNVVEDAEYVHTYIMRKQLKNSYYI